MIVRCFVYNFSNVKISQGQDRGQGQFRVCSAGRVQEEQEAVHYEDNWHFQDGPEANRGGSHGGSVT